MRRVVLAVAVVFSAFGPLRASPTFDFALIGLDGAGGRISGTAIFTLLDAHHFSVTITNTTAMRGAEQLLAGLEFDAFANGVTLIDSTGGFIELSGGIATQVPAGKTGWGAQQQWSDILLCAQCGDGNGSYIIGNGPYPSGLDGTYLSGPVTFEFSTDSSMPMDGSDPFSGVELLFGFGSDPSGPSGGWSRAGTSGQLTTGGSQAPGSDNPNSPGGGPIIDPGKPPASAIPEAATWSLSAAVLMALGAAKGLRRKA